jgi:uncharacterized repeat protein (TIGR04138 family)
MQQTSFEEDLNRMLESNPGYPRDAYLFLREALEFTQREKYKRTEMRHVSGGELLDGIRKYALNTFGPMALTVLNDWGIRECQDFGKMVFQMIDHNLLRKNEQDSFDDFKAGYSFEEAFRDPFLPAGQKKLSAPEPKPAKLDYTST